MGHRNEMGYVQASAPNKSFRERLTKIERRHSKLSKGYLMTVTHDGLVVAKPRGLMLRFPLPGLMATLVAVIFFKAFAFAYLGAPSYDAKILALSAGTTSERMAAFLMQADPVTRLVAGKMAFLLH